MAYVEYPSKELPSCPVVNFVKNVGGEQEVMDWDDCTTDDSTTSDFELENCQIMLTADQFVWRVDVIVE